MSKAAFKFWSDALEIVWQQLEHEIPRGFFWRPWTIVLLVCAEQNALALLSGVNFAGEVDHVWQLFAVDAVELDDFFHWFGHQVVMLHCQNRKFDSAHATHFSGPQTTCVDDMFGVNRVVFVGDYIPCAVWAVVESSDPSICINLGATIFCTNRVCVCNTIRIDAAFVFVVKRTDEIFFFKQWI